MRSADGDRSGWTTSTLNYWNGLYVRCIRVQLVIVDHVHVSCLVHMPSITNSELDHHDIHRGLIHLLLTLKPWIPTAERSGDVGWTNYRKQQQRLLLARGCSLRFTSLPSSMADWTTTVLRKCSPWHYGTRATTSVNMLKVALLSTRARCVAERSEATKRGGDAAARVETEEEGGWRHPLEASSKRDCAPFGYIDAMLPQSAPALRLTLSGTLSSMTVSMLDRTSFATAPKSSRWTSANQRHKATSTCLSSGPSPPDRRHKAHCRMPLQDEAVRQRHTPDQLVMDLQDQPSAQLWLGH